MFSYSFALLSSLFLLLPQVSEAMFIFFILFFSLSCRSDISITTQSSQQIISSVISNLLLSSFSDFFHLCYCNFNTIISIWRFLKLLSPYWYSIVVESLLLFKFHFLSMVLLSSMNILVIASLKSLLAKFNPWASTVGVFLLLLSPLWGSFSGLFASLMVLLLVIVMKTGYDG